MSKIFGDLNSGSVVAIANWRQRRSADDVCITVPLNPEQVSQYQELRAQGLNEEEIYDQIFQRQAPVAALKLESLTNAQLRHLVEQILQTRLLTLERVHRGDLIAMIRALQGRIPGAETVSIT